MISLTQEELDEILDRMQGNWPRCEEMTPKERRAEWNERAHLVATGEMSIREAGARVRRIYGKKKD